MKTEPRPLGSVRGILVPPSAVVLVPPFVVGLKQARFYCYAGFYGYQGVVGRLPYGRGSVSDCQALLACSK